MNISQLLRQPYPVPETAGNEWIVGGFIGGFLLLFQPFGISDWQTPDKIFKILGFGIITTGVMLLVTATTRQLPRFFAETHWTVGREILKVLALILLISIANRVYLSWLMGTSLRGGWLYALGMTFLLGIFPTVGLVMANYIVQLRRYRQGASSLLTYPPPAPGNVPAAPRSENIPNPNNDPITLLAENEKDSLTLLPPALLALESSDNYCTVHYLKNGLPTKELLRSSLSRLETQLGVGTGLVRCHRTYLVNLSLVERVTGNAQGYKLHLANNRLTVPVARQYNETLVAGLKQTR